jgi:1-piperideine-2-carboxylate/1-pyrroline-2-carboxylate reductase [NAD(P)H]
VHPKLAESAQAYPSVLDAEQTAARLPWAALKGEVEAVLADPAVVVAPRLVDALPGGGSLFAMPSHDQRVACVKLITYTPANAAVGLPAIQGDVLVFDIATGERRLILHGPTVTARRTAAVSLLAAELLAATPQGPLLIVGAGVQGRAHLEAFAACLRVREVVIASRSLASAQSLAEHARTLGLQASTTNDPNAALADCPLVVVCTPATQVVLGALPRQDTFMAAVGAFTPTMVELGPALCQHFAAHGKVVLDSADAEHEAGDLLQAGLLPHQLAQFPTLGQAMNRDLGSDTGKANGPVLFKSCGWAGWDLAAARLACAAGL